MNHWVASVVSLVKHTSLTQHVLTISVCNLVSVAIGCNNDKSLVLAQLPCLIMYRHTQSKVLYITVMEKAYYTLTVIECHMQQAAHHSCVLKVKHFWP